MRFLKSELEREELAQLEAERARRDLEPDRRWEYTVLRLGPKARAEGPLNELGAKGWQLVQVIEVDGHLAFYLEREVGPDDDTLARLVARRLTLAAPELEAAARALPGSVPPLHVGAAAQALLRVGHGASVESDPATMSALAAPWPSG